MGCLLSAQAGRVGFLGGGLEGFLAKIESSFFGRALVKIGGSGERQEKRLGEAG